MDTYSVLDALRRTNMGKLSYSRDFDLRDFDKLCLNDKDDSAFSPLETIEVSPVIEDGRGTATSSTNDEFVPQKNQSVLVDEGKENLSELTRVGGRSRTSTPIALRQASPKTLVSTPISPSTTALKSSLSRSGSPKTSLLSSNRSSTPPSISAPAPNSSRRRSKVTFIVEDSFASHSAKVPSSSASCSPVVTSSLASIPNSSCLDSPSTALLSPTLALSYSGNNTNSGGLCSPKSPSSFSLIQSPKSPSSPKSPPTITKKEMEALQALNSYELQIEERSRECVNRRQSRMSEASKLNRLRAEEEYERKKKNLESRQEQQYNDLQKASYVSMQETRRTIELKLANDAKHKHDLETKLKEAEMHKREHEKKKAKEKEDLLNSLGSLESEMKALKSEILASVEGCRFPHLLSDGSKPENVQNLLETMDNYMQGQKAFLEDALDGVGGHPSTSKILAQSIEIVETVKKVKLMIEEEISRVAVEGEKEEAVVAEEARKREVEEEEQKKREEQEKKIKELEEERQAAAAAAATTVAASEPDQQPVLAAANATAVADASSGAQFLALTQQKLIEFESVYAGLTNDKDVQTKRVKFDLQKAVNTLVNSLANDPREHRHRGIPNLCSCPSIQTVGRVRKLIDLHCGQRVDSGSGKWVCVSEHPQGLAFVSDLTAKKIVKQGSDVVASNKAHAYPVAAVSVALWIQNPAFGKLLVSRFHEICIFTVPLYPKHLSNQSQGDYYKSLGYIMDGDKAENQDDFLARMSGIIRLFATICLTQPPPKGLFGDKNADDGHPFGLPAAWNWLISHLRLDPISDVSATVLYEFLVVLGNALLKTYTKQFTKVVVVLIKSYLPRIEAVTMEGRLGPVMRLKEFLENSIRCGGVEPPKGQLPEYFWTPAEQTQRDDY